MFVTTVRWEYALVPTHPTRRFVAVSDIDEFRDVGQDRAATSAWYLWPQPGVDAGSRDCFELLDFTVNGEPQKIHRTSKVGSQSYGVSIGQDAINAGKALAVAYTFRTVVPVDGNLLQLRMDQPVRGLAVDLDYTDTNVQFINVLDFLESAETTRVTRSGTDVERAIHLDFDGWVFARSGVAFVWSNSGSTAIRSGMITKE